MDGTIMLRRFQSFCVVLFLFDDFEEHLGMQNVCVEHLGTNGILYIWWTDPAGDS